jgi:hypothetical protein
MDAAGGGEPGLSRSCYWISGDPASQRRVRGLGFSGSCFPPPSAESRAPFDFSGIPRGSCRRARRESELAPVKSGSTSTAQVVLMGQILAVASEGVISDAIVYIDNSEVRCGGNDSCSWCRASHPSAFPGRRWLCARRVRRSLHSGPHLIRERALASPFRYFSL